MELAPKYIASFRFNRAKMDTIWYSSKMEQWAAEKMDANEWKFSTRGKRFTNFIAAVYKNISCSLYKIVE